MKLTFDNIVPSYSDGRVQSIAFRAVLTADDGATETADLIATNPREIMAPGTDIELLVSCREQAARENVEIHLTTILLGKKTPRYTAPPVVELSDADKKAIWMQQVDATISTVLGHFTRFERGYELREVAARAYRDAGYTGEVSGWISGFADSFKIGYQAAADTIIAQADLIHAGHYQLDAVQRMRKYAIATATIAEAEAIFNDIMAKVSEIEASLP